VTSRDLEAVLFDMDGVLVDSRVAISRSINHALEQHGLEPLREVDLHGFIGAPLPEVFEGLLHAQERDPELAGSCVAQYRRRYVSASLTETVAYAGMPEALTRLAQRYRLAVATTKPAEFARPILEMLGLADALEAILGSPLHPTHSEPKSVTVGRALEALGVSRGAMVGDRHYDVAGGKAHGLFTVGVTWGAGTEAELREAGAAAIVYTPGELVGLLDAPA
jgi:phosphoglycolate phosphatase